MRTCRIWWILLGVDEAKAREIHEAVHKQNRPQ